MVQESEIITLLSGLISVLLILLIFQRRSLPKFRYFYIGFFLIISAYVFTLLEGLFWYRFFNLLEHGSYAGAAVLFAAAVRSLHRTPQQREKE